MSYSLTPYLGASLHSILAYVPWFYGKGFDLIDYLLYHRVGYEKLKKRFRTSGFPYNPTFSYMNLITLMERNEQTAFSVIINQGDEFLNLTRAFYKNYKEELERTTIATHLHTLTRSKEPIEKTYEFLYRKFNKGSGHLEFDAFRVVLRQTSLGDSLLRIILKLGHNPPDYPIRSHIEDCGIPEVNILVLLHSAGYGPSFENPFCFRKALVFFGKNCEKLEEGLNSLRYLLRTFTYPQRELEGALEEACGSSYSKEVARGILGLYKECLPDFRILDPVGFLLKIMDYDYETEGCYPDPFRSRIVLSSGYISGDLSPALTRAILHAAVFEDNIYKKLILLLLEKGADPTEALQYASENFVALLIRHGYR